MGIGLQSLESLTTGYYNMAIGGQAGQSITTENNNSFVGGQAGKEATGAGNISIGFSSGKYSTGNILAIDNQVRADAATELTNSILYGVMAAAPADQTLRVNADLILGDVSTLEVGGLTGVAYNAFANSGEAPEETE